MSAPPGIQTYTSAPLKSTQEEEPTHTTTSQPEPATAMESSTDAPSQPPTTTATATATAPSNPPIYTAAQPSNLAQPGSAPTNPTPTPTATATSTSFSTPSTTHTPPEPEPVSRPSRPTPETANAAAPPRSSLIPPPPKAGEAVSQPSVVHRVKQSEEGNHPALQSYAQPYYSPPNAGQSAVPNSTSSPYSGVYHTSAGGYTQPVGYGSGSGSGSGVGSGVGSGGGASSIFAEEEEEGFVGAAKGWLKWSGNKLAEVEKEVWKKINDVHD